MKLFSKDAYNYQGITIILSKPSRFDLKKKQILSGYAGDLFLKYLHPLDLLSVDVRTLEEHKEHYKNKLREDTKVVLLMDQPALDSLLPAKGALNDLRGNVYTKDSIHYIPTYAPQNAVDMKNWEYPKDHEKEEVEEDAKNHGGTQRKNFRYWLYRDIHKAIRISRFGKKTYKPFRQHNPCSFAMVNPVLARAKGETWILDIETTKNFSLTVITVACLETRESFTIPFYSYTGETYFNIKEYPTFFKILAESFKHNKWIAHNSMFDFFILAWRFKIPPPKDIYDTMIARHRLEPEMEKSLGHCVSDYLDLPYHKDDGVFEPKNHFQEHSLWSYNAKDVETTGLVYEEMQQIIGDDVRLQESVTRGMSFIRPFLISSLQGVLIDRTALHEERRRLDSLYKQYQRVVNILVGYELNINSPKQIAEYLYDFKKYAGKSKLAKETNSKTLIRLILKHNVPVLRVILRMRSLAKDRGVLDFAGWGANGDRFTTSMNPAGTKTMRNASSSLLSFKKTYQLQNNRQVTASVGYGSNVQNIKKPLRRFFIPDPGKIFVNADQAGAEALIVAYLARPGKYRNLFLHNVKPHSFMAMHLFAKEFAKRMDMKFLDFLRAFLKPDVETFTKHPRWKELAKLIKDSDNWEGKRYYYLGKKVCHASNYGMGVNTFIESIMDETNGALLLDKAEARKMLNMYFLLFPEIEDWHVEIKQQLAKDGTLYNLFGDRRRFYGHPNDAYYRDAFSWIPQSTVGVLSNIGLAKLQDKIETDPRFKGTDFLINVHDSMMPQTLIGQERFIAKELCQMMAHKFTTPYGEFTMKSEAQIGYNWKELYDIEVD